MASIVGERTQKCRCSWPAEPFGGPVYGPH